MGESRLSAPSAGDLGLRFGRFAGGVDSNGRNRFGKAMNQSDIPKAQIAVVGGTHLNDYIFTTDLLEVSFVVQTGAGESPQIHFGRVGETPFYYVHFHGEGKWLETWLALRDLGVTEVIGGATTGGISRLLNVGDILIPDDFIDRNVDRIDRIPGQYLADPSHALCRFTPPCDASLRKILIEEAWAAVRSDEAFCRTNIIERGTVIQSRFGRFETKAEIAEYAKLGADVVTHNLVTEMIFAKQLGIHFAAMHVVSNPAEGVAPWSFDSLADVYLKLNPMCWKAIEAAIPRIAAIAKDEPRTLDSQREHPPLSYRDALKRK